ncbi:MAG: toxin glutamine deamidase domain-containing protein [bacterium]
MGRLLTFMFAFFYTMLAAGGPDDIELNIVQPNNQKDGRVHLGQTFKIIAKVPDTSGPDDTVTVELSNWRGQKETVTLTKQSTEGGKVVFSADVSIGGKRGGFRYDGTVTELDELTNGNGVTARVTGYTIGASTNFNVYDSEIKLGIARIKDGLRILSDDLVRQKSAINKLKRLNNVPADVKAEIQRWETAVNTRLRWIGEARTVMSRAMTRRGPKATLIAGNAYLKLVATDLMNSRYSPYELQEIHGIFRLPRTMKQAVTDTYINTATAVTIATYVLITDLTMTRPLYTAVSGQNIFGKQVTGKERVFAVGEILLAVTLMRAMPKLVDWLANNAHNLGRGFRVPTGVKPKPATGTTTATPTAPVRTPAAPPKVATPAPAQPAAPKPAARPRTGGDYNPTTTMDKVKKPRAAEPEPYKPTTTMDEVGPVARPRPPIQEAPYSPTTTMQGVQPPNIRGRPPQTITEVLNRLRKINPGFDQNVPGTRVNCQLCTDRVWRVLRGEPATQAPRTAGGKLWKWHGKEATKHHPGEIPKLREWHEFKSPKEITDLFSALPPLSHGRMVGWRNNSSHIFNVWKDVHGRVWFIDGQTGRIAQFTGQSYNKFSVLLTDTNGALPGAMGGGARLPMGPAPRGPAPAGPAPAGGKPITGPSGSKPKGKSPGRPTTGSPRPVIQPGNSEDAADTTENLAISVGGGEFQIFIDPINFEINPITIDLGDGWVMVDETGNATLIGATGITGTNQFDPNNNPGVTTGAPPKTDKPKKPKKPKPPIPEPSVEVTAPGGSVPTVTSTSTSSTTSTTSTTTSTTSTTKKPKPKRCQTANVAQPSVSLKHGISYSGLCFSVRFEYEDSGCDGELEVAHETPSGQFNYTRWKMGGGIEYQHNIYSYGKHKFTLSGAYNSLGEPMNLTGNIHFDYDVGPAEKNPGKCFIR